jgi:hypothetical protein
MLTDDGLGIEYESHRQKSANIGKTQMALVAGDMTFHSDVLQLTLPKMLEETRTTLELARMYGDGVAQVRRSRAEKRILQPLNLTFDSFLATQTQMSPKLVDDLSYHLQQYQVEAEAIIAGCDGKHAYLYQVDSFGNVTNHEDIGFLSIGSGGIHSSAYFMQEPHGIHVTFPHALMSTFLAKRRAEVAPGVGQATDMYIINGEGADLVDPQIVRFLGNAEQELRSATTAKISELRDGLLKEAQEKSA